MSAISVFRRVEKKYRMDPAGMESLLPAIKERMDEDSYCVGGNYYRICNLYFDTTRDDVIRESLKKPFFKEKLRMRSYGYPETEDSPVFLELKRKVNGIVTKRRATLPYAAALAFLDQGTIPEGLSYMNRQVMREISAYLQRHPIETGTLLTYERSAWFGREDSDPGFRITFDRNICCSRGVMDMNHEAARPLLADDFILMEAKVEGAFPLWFSRLLAREKIRHQSFSKYGVAYKTWLKEDRFEKDRTINVLGPI